VLLRQTGVLPELDRDTTTQAPLQPGRAYRLHPEAGVQPAEAGADGAVQAHQAQALEQALARGSLPELRCACRLNLPALRLQLRPLLHYHLGSPNLRTRQLMLDVRRLLEAPAVPAAP
jgi:DNA repair protein RecO (recombination protein O)